MGLRTRQLVSFCDRQYEALPVDAKAASSAHVLFNTPTQALDAVHKLHAHVFKGALLSVTLKKRLDGLASASTKKAKPKPNGAPASGTGEQEKEAKTPAPSRASRLIVRNLPFGVSDQDLRAVFLPCGPIYSIHIPTTRAPKEGGGGGEEKEKQRGFAFVWMFSRKDAEKAIEECNGVKMRSGMAEQIMRDKQRKKKERREERRREAAEGKRLARKEKEKANEEGADGGVEDGDEEDEAAEAEEEKPETVNERIIAVDWALSKEKWEEEKAKMEENASESGSESEETSSSDGDESESDDAEVGSEYVDESEANDDEDEALSGTDADADEAEGSLQKPQLPATDVGTTLFIRNVPYEATEEELRILSVLPTLLSHQPMSAIYLSLSLATAF
jgi:nucleolar protein 4